MTHVTRRAQDTADRAETTAIADWLRDHADPTDLALLDEILDIPRGKTVLRGGKGTYLERPHRDRRPGMVRLLAARYANRDGYRPEWAPTTPPA